MNVPLGLRDTQSCKNLMVTEVLDSTSNTGHWALLITGPRLCVPCLPFPSSWGCKSPRGVTAPSREWVCIPGRCFWTIGGYFLKRQAGHNAVSLLTQNSEQGLHRSTCPKRVSFFFSTNRDSLFSWKQLPSLADSSTALPSLLERWRRCPGGPVPESGRAPGLPSGPEANPLIFKHKNLLQVRIWTWFPGLSSGQRPLKAYLRLAVQCRAVIPNASAGGCIVYATSLWDPAELLRDSNTLSTIPEWQLRWLLDVSWSHHDMISNYSLEFPPLLQSPSHRARWE